MNDDSQPLSPAIAGASTATPANGRFPPGPRRLLVGLVVAYTLAIVLLAIWMTWRGDRGWLATLFLFGPRWLCSLPWYPLCLAAMIWQRRLLIPLALAAVIILWPIMGLTVHWPVSPATPGLRVMTCNVDQTRIDTRQLNALIVGYGVDIVALQEVASATTFVWPANWHVIKRHEYILASRYPIAEREHVRRPTPVAEMSCIRFTVQLPQGEIQVFNTHLESPRAGLVAVLSRTRGIRWSQADRLREVIQMRAEESRLASAWLAGFDGPKIVMGDFNAPIESRIFAASWGQLGNAFSRRGLGFGFTKFSHELGFTYGTRIDHVLYTDSWHCLGCWRGAEVGSDHRPLVADFALPPSS